MPATPFQRDKTLKGHYSVLYFSFAFHTVIIYEHTALYDVKSGEIEIAPKVEILLRRSLCCQSSVCLQYGQSIRP